MGNRGRLQKDGAGAKQIDRSVLINAGFGLPTWPQDTLSHVGPQPGLNGRGPKLRLCRCTSFPTNKGAVGTTQHSEERVIDLGTS